MAKVLHASKSGYFPFCIPVFSGGTDQFTTANLEDAMKMYWVLRTFSITGSYNGPDDSILDFSIVLTNSAAKEEEIVCNPNWSILSSSSLNNINGSWYNGGQFYTYQDLIVPDYTISALYDDGGGAGFAITSQNYSSYEETFDFENMTFYGASGNALSFSLTALSFWSYGETYNTSTGERL